MVNPPYAINFTIEQTNPNFPTFTSSYSNHSGFPEIDIRDMVNSQYKLLTEYLHIEYIELLIGVSMGGMQAFEWMVAYPDFMSRLISINGTTKASFYDKALWSLIVTLIKDAGHDKEAITYAMQRVSDIGLLASTSPHHLSKTYASDKYDEVKTQRHAQLSDPMNKLAQSKAILEHDIYKDRDITPQDLAWHVKARVMIITAEKDHVVNPIYSRELSEILDCDFLELTGDCGHIAAFCDFELVQQAITEFLNNWSTWSTG